MKKAIAIHWSLSTSRHTLGRYRPMLLFYQTCLLLIGTFFYLDAIQGAKNFSAATWGELAYSLPAEMHAIINMTGAAFSIVGLIRPTRRRLVVLGSAIHTLMFATNAWSAMNTDGDAAVALYAGIMFLPASILQGYLGWFKDE